MPDLVKMPLVSTGSKIFPSNKAGDLLRNLQESYTFIGPGDAIAAVLEQVPAVYSLLRDALEPLRAVFGEKKLLQLEALEAEEDTTLRVMVKLPSSTTRPSELMRQFKQDWWLKNCSRSAGALVFDYEIGNGF